MNLGHSLTDLMNSILSLTGDSGVKKTEHFSSAHRHSDAARRCPLIRVSVTRRMRPSQISCIKINYTINRLRFKSKSRSKLKAEDDALPTATKDHIHQTPARNLERGLQNDPLPRGGIPRPAGQAHRPGSGANPGVVPEPARQRPEAARPGLRISVVGLVVQLRSRFAAVIRIVAPPAPE